MSNSIPSLTMAALNSARADLNMSFQPSAWRVDWDTNYALSPSILREGITLMPTTKTPQFKAGDVVEILDSYNSPAKVGQLGIIRDGLDTFQRYTVDFSQNNTVLMANKQADNLHCCDDRLPADTGWYFPASMLQLALMPKMGKPKEVKKPLFDTVIISDDKRKQIVEALEQLHQGDLIFNKWGFADTIEKGKGVSMLFYGPPGTGKTLMGSAIAEMLGYDMKIIGVADLESSQPGQTERNMRDLFETYSNGKSVLLFDECDSLIFDRTVVGAILGAQVNQLLSSLETFDGVTIFTTNRLETLDEAVNRRLALKLEFGMPSPEERAKIWARMFPKAAPLATDVDFTKLSQVEIAGGHIKNAVLRAARIAASDKSKRKKQIRMEHLVRALSEEGKSMVEFQAAKAKWHAPARPAGYMLSQTMERTSNV